MAGHRARVAVRPHERTGLRPLPPGCAESNLRATSAVPRHQRATIAPLAAAARGVLAAELSEGDERLLDSLIAAPLSDGDG